MSTRNRVHIWCTQLLAYWLWTTYLWWMHSNLVIPTIAIYCSIYPVVCTLHAELLHHRVCDENSIKQQKTMWHVQHATFSTWCDSRYDSILMFQCDGLLLPLSLGSLILSGSPSKYTAGRALQTRMRSALESETMILRFLEAPRLQCESVLAGLAGASFTLSLRSCLAASEQLGTLLWEMSGGTSS